VFISWGCEAVALYQSAEMRATGTDGSVDILPVVKELLVGQARLLGDAINKFDRGPLHPCPPQTHTGGLFCEYRRSWAEGAHADYADYPRVTA
jgi:hypothetical protein